MAKNIHVLLMANARGADAVDSAVLKGSSARKAVGGGEELRDNSGEYWWLVNNRSGVAVVGD